MVEGQAPRRSFHGSGRSQLATALAMAWLAGPATAQVPCAAWPGEPDPLPRITDTDTLRARWAGLRARELNEAAARLEPGDPQGARTLWQHVLCIAPRDPEAAAGLAEPVIWVAIHRPELRRGSADAAAGEQGGDAWAELDAPIALAAPPAPQRSATRQAENGSASVDALLRETAGHLRAARFEAALESAQRARPRVATLTGKARASRSAQLEVFAATAALALGREAEARDCLGRALDANPALHLDPATTSPKVQRAFDAVRAERTR